MVLSALKMRQLCNNGHVINVPLLISCEKWTAKVRNKRSKTKKFVPIKIQTENMEMSGVLISGSTSYYQPSRQLYFICSRHPFFTQLTQQ